MLLGIVPLLLLLFKPMGGYAQNSWQHSNEELTATGIRNQRITVADNGDVLAVAENAAFTHPALTDTVVVNYSSVSANLDRDVSIWKENSIRPLVFYFPFDSHLLIRSYAHNADILTRLDNLLDSGPINESIDEIEIIGACSPVGSEEYNMKLALSRCVMLRTYLRRQHPGVIEKLPIRFNIIGIDSIGYNILKAQNPTATEKETWNKLQYAAIRLKTKNNAPPQPEAPQHISDNPPQQPLRDTIFLKCDTVYVTTTQYIHTERMPKTSTPLYLGIKTNLLHDALLLPNLAVEWYMGNKWSLTLEGNWSWWTFDRPIQNLWYHRIQTVGMEVKRWFKSAYPLHGHALGVYSMVGNYDVRFFAENEYTKGYLSNLSWGAGVTYAYSLPIARRFNLEFALGVGYMGGRYYKYNYCTQHNHWAQQAAYNRNYVGPTRASVSLVWLPGAANDEKSRKKYANQQQRKYQQYMVKTEYETNKRRK